MADDDPIAEAQTVDQLAAVAKTFAQASLTTYGELSLDAWKVLAGEEELSQEKLTKNVTTFWGTVARDAMYSQALLQRFLEIAGVTGAAGGGAGTGGGTGGGSTPGTDPGNG